MSYHSLQVIENDFSVYFRHFALHSGGKVSRSVRVVVAMPPLERFFSVEKYQLQSNFLKHTNDIKNHSLHLQRHMTSLTDTKKALI